MNLQESLQQSSEGKMLKGGENVRALIQLKRWNSALFATLIFPIPTNFVGQQEENTPQIIIYFSSNLTRNTPDFLKIFPHQRPYFRP